MSDTSDDQPTSDEDQAGTPSTPPADDTTAAEGDHEDDGKDDTAQDNTGGSGQDEAEDIWAEAFQEQQQQESAPTDSAPDTESADTGSTEAEAPAAGSKKAGTPTASATGKQDPGSPSRDVSDQVFKPLQGSGEHVEVRDMEMIMNIPVRLSVELGRTRITIKQLLELAKGSVVELDGLAGEPMDILINGYLIARGEVVVVEGKYGIRIAEIITPSERVQKLNR